MQRLISSVQQKGFTLIEVMLVILVIGVLMSAVQFTFQSSQSHQQLEKAAARFAGVFELASEYGMLNNIELGLLVTDEGYQFVGYDGTKWTELPEVDALAGYQLPASIALELTLDDLPIENDMLVSHELFQDEQDDFKPEEKPIQPQVVILSGGDISPFSLAFFYRDEFAQDELASYKVTGLYYTPLTIEGPIFDE
ncbi:type II secretion system minor pseudopilin GspH [Thalassotalea sp. M1531]|uniref:Type II secretion system protein H n=1 Tax=Thalassotalea algicola TaxID=2716224 RepID=A0A7Y0LA49_9GAMM|nr:type II secretion system minor pseudopilin GspH [Thalassotalea algicola]NMP30428.1 type II secretion system minor pseudopilin GspH [Thalassotalea algicola]